MPWRETSVVSERINFVRAAEIRGVGHLARLCREFGISRRTGYRWLERVRGQEWILEAVQDRSRRPYHSPSRTSAALEQRVIKCRRQEGWGGKKIQVMLLAEGVDLKVVTINRILKRHGLFEERTRDYSAPHRFERSVPNELVQMDFKGDYGLTHGRCYPLTLLDDHSRFSLGVYALADQKAENVQRCLIRSFERYGVPEEMLMDHGSPWFSSTNSFGLTWLTVWLIRQGIQVCFSGVGHPQTQGKIERFHRTLKESLAHHGQPTTLEGFQKALDHFRKVYNQQRPHEALGMAVPASRYQPSSRAYSARIPEWIYPAGAIVKRLNSQGVLDCPGGRRFVCEALANQQVQIEQIGNHWLIKYRHQYVREIDLASGRTLPPVRPLANRNKNV